MMIAKQCFSKILKFLTLLLLLPSLCFGAASEDFNGTTSISATTQNSTINNLDTLSLIVWINADTLGEGSLGRISDKRNANNDGAWIFYGNIQPAFEQHRWNTANGAWKSDTAISFNVWEHHVVTYDGSSTANDAIFYLNGAAVGTTEGTAPQGTLQAETETLNIGNNDATTRTFDGEISSFAVYNRVLSVSEVAEVMLKPEMIPSGLVMLTPIWGDSPNVDLSENTNTASSTNTTVDQDGPPVFYGGGLPL